jgi:two-component system cell cycle response regulator CtrA
MHVDTCETGEDALDMARTYDYDVAVLDLVLPDMEGFDVVRKLRAARIRTPVAILSGLTRTQAKVRGLELGADDFIPKPFDPAELVARINAIVRRSRGFAEPVLAIGNVRLRPQSREVFVHDRSVALTAREFAVLELLVLRKGIALTKDAFLNHLYGGVDEPEIKIIDVFICKIRKKLAAAGADEIIHTVWGRGYMCREPAAPRISRPEGTTALPTAA